MTVFNVGVTRLFLSTVLAVFMGTLAMPSSAQGPDGVLHLYDGDSLVCSLPFINSTVNFRADARCDNDRVKEFKLEGVPSATFFAFYDDPDCTESGNFAFRFKTVKHYFTMPFAMNIGVAGKKEVGTVVTPGVLLISSTWREQVDGKLSCVRIERSAVPAP